MAAPTEEMQQLAVDDVKKAKPAKEKKPKADKVKAKVEAGGYSPILPSSWFLFHLIASA